MLKPLIQAIPQKELLIEGKYYKVYALVKLLDNGVRKILWFSMGDHKVLKSVKTFPSLSGETYRDAAIHNHIESILTEYHAYIEKNYKGDSFYKPEKKMPEPTIFRTKQGNREYICIGYTFKRHPSEIVGHLATTNASKAVGNAKYVTQEDIDARMLECKHHQKVAMEIFQKWLAEKRGTIRAQIEKEIAERDSQLA